ncbi:hypothetical protein O6H91_01G083500 [Diphasiastrum complanatum]|uniref:Uncharacterized protein n=1 Tax=Diphasiastrum complanatum TaxID=34168 RepID=A0ACC2ESZ7_DIPCM|nr:hypothetical protein O6H91_01G083500 [Diphasiastrum complanatum]
MRRRRRHGGIGKPSLVFFLIVLIQAGRALCRSMAESNPITSLNALQLRRNGAFSVDGAGKRLLSFKSGDESLITQQLDDGLLPLPRKEADGKIESEGKVKEGHEIVQSLVTEVEAEQKEFVDAKNKSESQEDGKAASKGMERLLERLEDEVQIGTGRFNETIEKQEGVLETVARVGKHSWDNDEAEDSDTKASTEEGEKLPEKAEDENNVNKNKSNQEEEDHINSKGLNSQSVSTFLDMVVHKASPVLDPPIIPKLSGINTTAKDIERTNATKDKAQEQSIRRYEVEDVARLIDRQDNEYVISNPGKRSQMHLQEDLTLISDIVKVIVAAAIGGLVCGLLGQPVILGYLAAGMVVGPGGFRLVHELVQVETLAQFGVVFLLFALGVEFNIAKMQGVQGVALGGGCIQILTAMFLGGVLASSAPQGVFIGAFLSMSSTAVVLKCLMDGNIGGTEQGQIMLGTLILQDFALGLLLAVMPALAAKGSSSGTIILALGRECLLLSGFCFFAWILSKVFIPRFLTTLTRLSKYSLEIYQLGIVGVCLCIALLSQTLGLGMEVGSFVAGLMLSGAPHSEKTLHQIEPIRNLFAALFLASIGMVIHPLFLWQHKDVLLASLAVVFFGKTCLIALVVRAFGYNFPTAISVGIALAQIGEFAFLLLSRAQTLGLVSRKLYLLLMGTSALSLVLTPFAFKIVIRLMPRDKRSQNLPFAAVSSVLSHGHNNHHDASDKKIGWQHATTVLVNNDHEIHEPSSWPVPSISASLVSNLGINDIGNSLACDISPKRMDRESEHIDGPKEGWVDKASLPQVTLRRPFSQVLSGGWKDWRE